MELVTVSIVHISVILFKIVLDLVALPDLSVMYYHIIINIHNAAQHNSRFHWLQSSKCKNLIKLPKQECHLLRPFAFL